MKKVKPKILVIVGPTASGKSALAVKIAKSVGQKISYEKVWPRLSEEIR